MKIETETHTEPLTIELREEIERLVTSADPTVHIDTISPDFSIICVITDFDQPRISTTTAGHSSGQTLVGALSVTFRIEEMRLHRVVASSTVRSEINDDLGTSSVRGLFPGLKSIPESTQKLPSIADTQHMIVKDTARQIASYLVITTDTITVQLAVGGNLEPANRLALANKWAQCLQQLQELTPLPDPRQDAYRIYNIGVAKEALAYESRDQTASIAYLHEAKLEYTTAAEALPDEVNFVKPNSRIESALAHYLPTGYGESAAAAPSLAQPAPPPLTNNDIIDLIHAHVSEDVIVDAITGAPDVEFDISSSGLIRLSNAGVRSQIQLAMRHKMQSIKSTLPEVTEKQEAPYQVVQILFATDRSLGSRDGLVQTFTGDRSPDDKVTLGEAEVSIPRDHRMGQLERPSLLRFETHSDPEKHISIVRADLLTDSQFHKQVYSRIQNDPQKSVLIFVHGYNVSFQDAAERLGQITYDLGFHGVPILFSWPSKGNIFSYTADEASAEWSYSHFIQFLESLKLAPDVNVYLVGHSMGNRLIENALTSMQRKPNSKSAPFKEVIMAAPDIDEGVFSHAAKSLRGAASRITIYENSDDKALVLSHQYHAFARLGDSSPKVHVYTGYECIEASSLDTGFLGHSYIGDNRLVLSDIYSLMMNGLPASKRGLVERRAGDMAYWSFRK